MALFRYADPETAVRIANLEGPLQPPSRDELVGHVNRCLNSDDVAGLTKALQNFDPQLDIMPFAATLYFSELNYIRQQSGIDLRADGIVKVCQFLNPVAQVNQAVEIGDPLALIYHCQKASVEDVSVDLKDKYLAAMREAVAAKKGQRDQLLNHSDIQEVVDVVNAEIANGTNMELIEAIHAVNRAVNSLDPSDLFRALQNPVLGLEARLESQEEAMKEIDAVHYLQLLRDIQRNRSDNNP